MQIKKTDFQLLETDSGLESLFAKLNLVDEVCNQIRKDLSSFSNAVFQPAKHTLSTLKNGLKPILFQLDQDGKILQFIYRVDLNETKFQQAYFDRNFDRLAFEVLRRETQKVLLRKLYKTSN